MQHEGLRMSDVFVSYKAEDRSRVEPLVGALEAEGLSVWWDARVSGGEAWRESIAKQLDEARCVIVIWSKRSTGPEGRFVRDEASRAQRRGTYLPITIDKVEPPLGFGETQALPLRSWKGDPSHPRYRTISDCVHSLLGRERSAGAPIAARPSSAARVDRRTAIAAGGATMVAAGIGGWLLLRPTAAKANTIAVLPFANLSGDPSQSYFSDGMAEEVRSALSATGGLEVVARTSSEMLRNADAISAAKRLDVANVVTGSVRRSPSTVRVSAQLVDGESGLERWSQSFDRPTGDVLQIQSDIAANVARALSVALGGAVSGRLSLGGTTNPQAQDLLLQATALEGDDSSAGMLRRIALLNQATRIDPNYAEAHARKALYQCVWGSTWAANDAEKNKLLGEALVSARRAIAIEPALPSGYASLGLIYSNRLEMKAALDAGRRSVDLAGADVPAFSNYGLVLSRALRQAEGETMMERATSLDPLNAQAWAIKSWVLLDGRRYRESVDAARHALSIAPKHLRARTLLAWDLLLLGHVDEAQRELQQVPADDYRRLVAEAAIATRAKRRDEALRSLEPLQKRYGDTARYQEAEIYAQLGDKEQAIRALQAAWSLRDPGMGAIQVDPFLDPVRTDPRFPALVKRVFG
jgi:TolB-like protein/Tfp pilus assembly protein PilF